MAQNSIKKTTKWSQNSSVAHGFTNCVKDVIAIIKVGLDEHNGSSSFALLSEIPKHDVIGIFVDSYVSNNPPS